MNVSRQIGWGTESNLLYQILKQLNRLTSVLFGLKEAATPKYKVYTALLTQSGDSSISDKVQGDSLDVGVTYTIASNTENADLTIFGAPNSNVGTSFVCTTAGVLPSIGNISLTYDTGAPVATVLENTIGNIWFTYNSVGSYIVTLANVGFQQNDTALFLSNSSYNQNGIVWTYVDGGGTISIETADLSGNYGDGYLFRNTLEIRVYN
jgi:hypothetical protein